MTGEVPEELRRLVLDSPEEPRPIHLGKPGSPRTILETMEISLQFHPNPAAVEEAMILAGGRIY